MKTNQLLTVDFTLGQVKIYHKTQMLELESFVSLINKYRIDSGMDAIPQRSILNRMSIKEYISHIGKDALTIGRGRGKSYINLKLALRMAIEMSPQMADEIIETFINKKLTHLRDLGGDNFIELNDAITLYAESVLGKPAHKGHFINVAKIIKKRLGVENWNEADSFQNSERMRIEQTLVSMLRTGVVKDWGHLKELTNIV